MLSWMKMGDAMDLPVHRGEMTGGFWIRRVVSPTAAAKRQQRTSRKEDRHPTGLVGPPLRRRRIQSSRRRSSLMPDWYPRTPLRDITAIVHAYERRRLRVQAVRRAAQLNEAGETSTENPQESSVTTDQNSRTDFTPVRVIPGKTFSSPVEHPLPTPSTSSSFSEINSTPSDRKLTEAEEELCRSIDQIEKIVRKNKKQTVKEASANKRVMQRKILMSMR